MNAKNNKGHTCSPWRDNRKTGRKTTRQHNDKDTVEERQHNTQESDKTGAGERNEFGEKKGSEKDYFAIVKR